MSARKKTPDLQAAADTAVAAWRAARATLVAAQSEAAGKGQFHASAQSRESNLAFVVAEIARIDAVDAERAAAVAASVALDAAESASGDELARAVDATCLCDALRDLDADEERARAALASAAARRTEIHRSSLDAEKALAARRKNADLPPPVRPPWAAGAVEPKAALAVLESRAAGVLPPAKVSTEKLRSLRGQEQDLRMGIETAHREGLKRKKEREDADREHARAKEEQAQRDRQNTEAWRAKVNAEAQEHEALISAQKDREARGEPSLGDQRVPPSHLASGWTSL